MRRRGNTRKKRKKIERDKGTYILKTIVYLQEKQMGYLYTDTDNQNNGR